MPEAGPAGMARAGWQAAMSGLPDGPNTRIFPKTHEGGLQRGGRASTEAEAPDSSSSPAQTRLPVPRTWRRKIVEKWPPVASRVDGCVVANFPLNKVDVYN